MRSLQRQETGLRQAAPTKKFATAAVAIGKRRANRNKPLTEFATQLVAKGNEALKALGCPALKSDFTETGAGAAVFDREKWKMWINTDQFSQRAGIKTIGDLSVGEAADIATSVWHEMRHAEQAFRVARMRAALSAKKTPEEIAKEISDGMKMDADAALAAARAPLAATKGNEKLLAEAKEWETITVGLHSKYKENITNWAGEARTALTAVREAEEWNADQTRATLGALVAGWTNNATRDLFLDRHVAAVEAITTKSPLDEAVIGHLKAVKPALAALKTAWSGVGAGWDTASDAQKKARLRAVEAAFKALEAPLYAAYLAHPHETDARETGLAAGAEFRKQATAK